MTPIRDGRAFSSGSRRFAALDGLPGVAFPALVVLVSIAAGLMAYGYCASLPFRAVPPDDIGCIRVGFRYAAAPLELPSRYLGPNWIRIPGHISYALNAAISGLDPRGWHRTNLILHLVNALLLAWLVWVITRNRVAVLVAGPAFAAWPSGRMAVEWVAARHDLILATVFLATFLLYALWRQRGIPVLYGASVLACALMLVSKETGVALGFSLLLAEPLLFDPPIRRRAILPFGLMVGAYAGFMVVHFGLFGSGVAPYLAHAGPRAAMIPRLLTALGALWSPWLVAAFPVVIACIICLRPRIGLWSLLTTAAVLALPAMLNRTDPIGGWHLYGPSVLVVLSLSCALLAHRHPPLQARPHQPQHREHHHRE